MARIPYSNDPDDKLFPVMEFFNIPDDSFIKAIELLAKGIGYSYNEVHCSFPGDLDPWEEPFEGVMFAIFEEEIVLDYPTVYQYLKQASRAYVAEHPEDMKRVEALLRMFRDRFHIEKC